MPQAEGETASKLPRTARGRKPVYLDSVTDKLLSTVLTLAGELSVTLDRLDTVERLLEKHQLIAQEEIDNFEPSESVYRLRMERRAAYIARVLKSVQDEIRG